METDVYKTEHIFFILMDFDKNFVNRQQNLFLKVSFLSKLILKKKQQNMNCFDITLS